MNKKLLLLIGLISFTLTIIIGSLYMTLNKKEPENSSSSVTYVLKKYNNTIAVFVVGEDSPYRVLDVAYNNLPFEDKELLNKGIYSESLSEIMKHAEDYDG